MGEKFITRDILMACKKNTSRTPVLMYLTRQEKSLVSAEDDVRLAPGRR